VRGEELRGYGRAGRREKYLKEENKGNERKGDKKRRKEKTEGYRRERVERK
jgi:hypothetical protein